MLSNDVIFQIAVLAMLAFVSLGTAIGTKGPVRTTLGYALFVINLAIVAGFVILKLNSLDNSLSNAVNPEYQKSKELIAEADELPSTVEEQKALQNAEQAASEPKTIVTGKTGDIKLPTNEPEPEPEIDTAPILSKFRKVQSKGGSIARELARFSIGDLKTMSDSEYETIIAKSNKMVGRASSLLREYNKVENRNSVSAADRKMAQALNTLNQGTRSLRAFFNAENGIEEEEYRAKYLRYANQAASQFNKALNGF
jgi:hypothetical protein